MRADFDGQDYFCFLDREQDELRKLMKEALSAPLKQAWEEKELGKTVILRYGENNGPDGIDLQFLPDGAESWNDIEQVQVTVSQRAYNHIEERGRFGTRYGMGNKIEIIVGLPDQI